MPKKYSVRGGGGTGIQVQYKTSTTWRGTIELWMVDEGGGGDRQVPLNCFYCITRISVLKPEWWQFYDANC